MSNLESLGKLLYCTDYEPWYDSLDEALMVEYGRESAARALWVACHGIAREIDERYVELPVDADGKPVRPGDLIEFGGGERLRVTHVGRTDHGEPTVAYRRPNGTLDCSCVGPECRHVSKPTVEEVLEEFYEHCQHYDGSWCSDWTFRDAVWMYAGKLREAMGE